MHNRRWLGILAARLLSCKRQQAPNIPHADMTVKPSSGQSGRATAQDAPLVPALHVLAHEPAGIGGCCEADQGVCHVLVVQHLQLALT